MLAHYCSVLADILENKSVGGKCNMLINFFAFILCAVCGVYQGILGNFGWCAVEIALALLNLPSAIKFIVKEINDEH